ncbi:MAG: mechanosensitive ion channel family protein [Microthrixaceae bacterium]
MVLTTALVGTALAGTALVGTALGGTATVRRSPVQVAPDPDAIDRAVNLGGLEPIDWIFAGVLLVGFLVGGLLLGRWARSAMNRTRAGDGTTALIGRLVTYSMVLVGVVWSLGSLGVAIGPLIGALGIGGIVLALALQGVLENVIAGAIIYSRRPFVVGDEIRTNGVAGRVIDVSARCTVIRQFTGELAYVPNSEVLNKAMVNVTSEGHRRTDVVVSVAFGTDVAHACRVAERALADIEDVFPEPPPAAHAFEFGGSSINLTVMAWHNPTEASMWRVRNQMIQAVVAAFDANGIEIPFPRRTLEWHPDAASPNEVPPAEGVD